MSRRIFLDSPESIESAACRIKSGITGDINKVRSEALKYLNSSKFTDTGGEAWKYTNTEELFRNGYELPDSSIVDKIDPIKSFPRSEEEYSVYILNGCVIVPPGMSSEKEEIEISITGTGKNPKNKINGIGKISNRKNTSFSALNMSLAEKIVNIKIRENMKVKKPIRIIHAFIPGSSNMIISPRVFINSENGAESNIIEEYYGDPGNSSLINGITEISVGEYSKLNYYRLETERDNSFNIASQYISLKKGAGFSSNLSLFGSPLSRNEIYTYLDGEEAESSLFGIYILNKDQHIDNHTEIFHMTPNSSSRENYHGILSGNSKAVFDGLIYVSTGADGTSSNQSNRSLLLSDSATVDSKPSLEIYAEDVKCSHSAAVGTMDEDSVYYLRSRGIPKDQAVKILTHGFASEITKNFKLESIKSETMKILSDKLAGIENE